jgi:hypothetical protein
MERAEQQRQRWSSNAEKNVSNFYSVVFYTFLLQDQIKFELFPALLNTKSLNVQQFVKIIFVLTGKYNFFWTKTPILLTLTWPSSNTSPTTLKTEKRVRPKFPFHAQKEKSPPGSADERAQLK